MVSSQPIVITVHRRPGRGAGRRGHAAGRDAGRAAAERGGARLRPRGGGRPRRRGRVWRGAGRGRRATRRWATSTSPCPTTGAALRVEVRDDGLGLPEGFDIEQTTSLGLSIVRDLVASQLEGTITMEALPAAEGGGTRVAISVPVRAPVSRGGATGCSCGVGSEGALRAAGGQPGLAELAALLFGGAAPDAGLLVGGQGEVEAGLERLAGPADTAWPPRSGRRPVRSCRRGRRGQVRCSGRRQHAASRPRPSRPSGST